MTIPLDYHHALTAFGGGLVFLSALAFMVLGVSERLSYLAGVIIAVLFLAGLFIANL